MAKRAKKLTYLYVDGSNLFKGITDLLAPGEYFLFSELIAQMEKKFQIDKVYFYGTYFHTDSTLTVTKQLEARAQRRFFDEAKNIARVTFIKGYYSSSKKEKGIDVKMAVDIVKDGYEDCYDEAIVMTGDDDFIYVISTAKKLKRPIHMATIGTRYGYGTAMNVHRKLILDYNKYFINNVQPTIRKIPSGLDIIEISSEVQIKKA